MTPTGTNTRLSLERPPGGICASTHETALVVSTKRARLQDLVRRLAGAGLADLVLDLSDGSVSQPGAVGRVAGIARGMTAEPRDAPAPVETPGAEVLRDYCEALHRSREPWGTSAYDAMVAAVRARRS